MCRIATMAKRMPSRLLELILRLVGKGTAMSESLVLIHTVPPLLEVFAKLCADRLTGIKPFHILDEPLLEQVRLHGSLMAEDVARLRAHVDAAQNISARAILVTCSTLSPAVDHIHASIPIFKIDTAMIEQAIALGSRIGVIATNQTTLGATQQLLLDQSARIGKPIQISLTLVENALPALLRGASLMHDRLVKQSIALVSEQVDVIVLAQASTARVLEIMPESERRVPMLASPHAAIERIRQWLSEQPAPNIDS